MNEDQCMPNAVPIMEQLTNNYGEEVSKITELISAIEKRVGKFNGGILTPSCEEKLTAKEPQGWVGNLRNLHQDLRGQRYKLENVLKELNTIV